MQDGEDGSRTGTLKLERRAMDKQLAEQVVPRWA